MINSLFNQVTCHQQPADPRHWLQVTSDGRPENAVPFNASRITLIIIDTV
jgi:hypothetical protein